MQPCAVILAYLLKYCPQPFYRTISFNSLNMLINNTLSSVFNVCVFVYLQFNFELLLAGATASSKSGIITCFTGMVKTVR